MTDRATPGRPRARSVLAGLAALSTALLLTGCSAMGGIGAGGEPAAATGVAAEDVHLQPVAAPGPDPFTASTARHDTPLTSPAAAPDAQGPREITGSAPGLYGGTRSVASCDVERQVTALAADRDRTRAFAEAAGIPETNVGGWLRGLTPVVLRVDTRVTNHGYRHGRPTAFQSVLQAGTAVLVDQYGSPRVRCACGNPLRTPVATPGAVHRGEPWGGFDPDRVIVVRPTTTVVTHLVIVNAVDNTWIERRTGTDGDADRKPDVAPDCDPDRCHLTGGGTSPVPTAPDPSAPGTTAPDTTPSDPAAPSAPASPPTSPDGPVLPDGPVSPEEDPDPLPETTDPAPPTSEPYPDPFTDPYAEPYPDPDADPYTDPYADPAPDPRADPDGPLPPEELVPGDPEPGLPETFEG